MKQQRIMNRIFVDNDMQQEYEKSGYVQFPFLNNEELLQLRKQFKSIRSTITDDVSSGVYATGCSPSFNLRQIVGDVIRQNIPARIKDVIKVSDNDILSGTMLLKSRGETGVLSPHIDNPIIDEKLGSSVFLWIPLEDVNEDNGCVYVLPGSHQIEHGDRGMFSPYPYKEFDDLIYNHGQPIKMKAGHALAMDHALIHYSLQNKSEAERFAFNLAIKPKILPQLHYYYSSESNQMEVYEANADFYFTENFFERPTNLKCIGKFALKSIGVNSLIQHCQVDLNLVTG